MFGTSRPIIWNRYSRPLKSDLLWLGGRLANAAPHSSYLEYDSFTVLDSEPTCTQARRSLAIAHVKETM